MKALPASSPGLECSGWYARVDRSGAADGPCGFNDLEQAGALTVWRSAGCEVARLGDGGAVLFDGYLFEADDIAAELGIARPSTTADIVAGAYARWGTTVFDRLDGCYLIAIWDASSRTFLLGHDALGRHPVFYVLDAGQVWFSGNILALARSGAVPTHPNRVSLALSAVGFWPETGQTYIQAIQRIQPGHFLKVTESHAAEHRYWDSLPPDEGALMDERVVHDQFEPALADAVRRCLAVGAEGIMLSGGVDSVTIAALASAQRSAAGRAPLVAVSGRTGYALSDEEVMQTKVAAALAMPHRISTMFDWIGGRNPLQMSLDLVPELPGPTDVSWVGTYVEFYRRTASEGLRHLLTGSGGDNWLGVADGHAADLMRRVKVVELYRFLRADVRTGGSSVRAMTRRLVWSGGLRWHLDSLWARTAPLSKARYHRRKWIERLPPWLAPDQRLREELVECLMARRTPSLTPDGDVPRNYYLHSLRRQPNPFTHHEFETGFHIESMCGLRLLSPYHDRRLVTFFNRIPPRVLTHDSKYKGLLRPVVARHLPGLGLEDQRKAYPLDLQKRKLEEVRTLLGALWPQAGLATLHRLGVLDGRGVREHVGDASRASSGGVARLFALMSADRWAEANTQG